MKINFKKYRRQPSYMEQLQNATDPIEIEKLKLLTTISIRKEIFTVIQLFGFIIIIVTSGNILFPLGFIIVTGAAKLPINQKIHFLDEDLKDYMIKRDMSLSRDQLVKRVKYLRKTCSHRYKSGVSSIRINSETLGQFCLRCGQKLK